jgi:methylated-DNA-[protein]-cysteine S-methyltransferase
MRQRYHGQLSTSLGAISFAVDEQGRLVMVRFAPLNGHEADTAGRCDRVAGQLAEYVNGDRTRFDLETAAHGTAFQHRVWRALQDIPYGVVVSYGEIARRIGMPRAARAIGQANGANPIPIVVPCHRVIAADGTIGGFSSGLVLKRRLLEIERVRLAA